MREIINRLLRRSHTSFQTIEDDFINHLRYVNPGFLHSGNLFLFDYAVRNMPDNTSIIEIGVFCGLSTNAISYFRTVHNKSHIKIYNTDIWKLYTFDEYSKIGKSGISHLRYRDHLIDVYKKNIEFFFGNRSIHTFNMDSDDFLKNWLTNSTHHDLWGRSIKLGGGIGFAYIDGSHLYDQVKKDFINVKDSIVSGGFILFDDSADDVFTKGDCEVSLLMKELLKNYSDEFQLVQKNPNYLFRKI